MTQEVQPELRKLTGLTLCVMLARAAADAAGEGKPAEANSPASSVADLLQIAPHSVPYALRVDMFRQLLRMDKEAIAGRRGGRKVTIRRDCVLEDAYKQLAPLGASIKEPFMVVFIDEHGTQEAGVCESNPSLLTAAAEHQCTDQSCNHLTSCCSKFQIIPHQSAMLKSLQTISNIVECCTLVQHWCGISNDAEHTGPLIRFPFTRVSTLGLSHA